MIWIGIDPGTHTGIAVWDSKQEAFTAIHTLPIHKALAFVLNEFYTNKEVEVLFEDARLRKWYGEQTNAKIQGAGSIKRDCTIWEEFLTDYKIPFHAIAPHKGMTKMNEEYFKMVAHWDKKTSNHARDAALLVLGR